ncbi:MAG TPA: hypothetical protein VN699_11255, partial [Pirellulales bacterium]|nr:hypothetical protein [Pirellulales bacterium]
ESVGEVLMKHLTAEPDLSAVEEPYRSAIARTLTKSPEGRLQSVAELAALLPAAPRSPTSTAPSSFAGPLPAATAPILDPPRPEPPTPPAAAAVVSDVVLVDEEPIARAVRDHWRQFRAAWNSGRISTPGRVAIVGVAIYLIITMNVGIVGMALSALLMYGAYFAVRSIVLAMRHPPGGRPSQRFAAAPADAPPMPRHPTPNAIARVRGAAPSITLPYKTTRDRIQELTGSLLISAAVAAVMGILLGVLRGKLAQPEQFAWLVLVGTIGAWAVLLPAKAWEHGEGEPMLRRCLLLFLGLGLGAFAYAAKDWLMVDLPYDWKSPHIDGRFYPQSFEFADAGGAPTLMGHMAYFAFLLVVLRWWRQADPFRPQRLSLWSTSVSIFWAWLLCYFWPFPQPWGLMIAATMSVAVQLASPWHGSRRRRPRPMAM